MKTNAETRHRCCQLVFLDQNQHNASIKIIKSVYETNQRFLDFCSIQLKAFNISCHVLKLETLGVVERNHEVMNTIKRGQRSQSHLTLPKSQKNLKCFKRINVFGMLLDLKTRDILSIKNYMHFSQYIKSFMRENLNFIVILPTPVMEAFQVIPYKPTQI